MGGLSEKDKEVIEALDTVPFNFGDDEVDLLLVWRGLKPATSVDFGFQWSPDDLPRVMSDSEIKDAITKIKMTGLCVTDPVRERENARVFKRGTKDEYYTPGFDRVTVCVAKEKSLAEKLARTPGAYVRGGESRTYGQLSGFPETATQAYVEVEERGGDTATSPLLIDRRELPEDVRCQDFIAFADFKFSKAHWREEIEMARAWAKEIKKIHPDLYAKKVNYYHKSLKGPRKKINHDESN